MVFLGVALAVVVLIGVYLLTMLAYFAVRKRNPDCKYLIEVVMVILSFGLSFVTKLAILLVNDHACFEDGFTAVLDAIYFSIGALAFDGIDMGVFGMSALNCLYSGTSVYAGIIFLSVVTAKASFDVYSGIRILFLRFSPSMRKGLVDLYLFNVANEECLLMAKSIDERYQTGERGGKKHLIIFSGETLESFDRKNAIHREIMANGYFYWQFSVSEKSAPKSLLKRFGFYIDNDFTQKNTTIDGVGEVHFFAFAKNSELSGLECENNNVVSSEISALTKEYLTAPIKKRSIVNFYLLTNTAIDYVFYNNFVRKTVADAIEASEVKPDEQLREKLTNFYFQLKVINEAELVAKNLSQRRSNLFASASKERSENLFLQDANGDGQNPFRAMVLGFGKTGQCALKELITATAFVDENGNAKPFYADVYEANAGDQFGIYLANHPQCICTNLGIRASGVEGSDISEQLKEGVKRAYSSTNVAFERIEKGLCFPVIALHSVSCFSYEFINYLDEKMVCERQGEKSNKSRYNAFIVALGNDEDNIKMANSLLYNLKREKCDSAKNTMLQTVYVNIRDKRNIARVLWSLEDEKRHANLKVITFGESREIYSYSYVIDKDKEIAYNHLYNNLVEQNSESGRLALEEVRSALQSKDDKNYDQALQNLYEGLPKYSKEVATAEWLKLDVWRKQSTSAANRFSENYKTFLSLDQLSGKNLYRLASIEHERWCRFYVMDGWSYGDYSSNDKAYYQANRYHKCICPMEMLDLSVVIYDVGNVLIAKKV